MQNFGDRGRVVRHLNEGSSRCRAAFLVTNPNPLPDDVYEQLETEEREVTNRNQGHGLRRTHADLPVYRLEGPLLNIAFEYGLSFETLHHL